MHRKFPCHALWLPAALSLLLQACGGSPKSSSTSGPGGGPVPTSRMSIELKVEANESGTAVVRANLNDGHSIGRSYRLDGGDFLRACVAGVCRTMADNDSVYSPDYIARFDYLAGVDYVVSFNRQQGQDALDSRVSLPPAFTLVTPADGQQVTDGDTVLVTWTPIGAEPARVAVGYEVECQFLTGPDGFSVGLLGTDADADGQESADIDEIVDFGSISTSPITSCSIELIVTHEHQGLIDPEFRNGTAMGIVSRRVTLDYVPL